jgi:hypothetical protein
MKRNTKKQRLKLNENKIGKCIYLVPFEHGKNLMKGHQERGEHSI